MDRVGSGDVGVVSRVARGVACETRRDRFEDSGHRSDLVPIEVIEDVVAHACQVRGGRGRQELAPGGERSDRIVPDQRPAVGGMDAFEQAVDVAQLHDPNIAWVFSITASAWAIVSRARETALNFDAFVQLPDWTEKQIAALLEARNAATKAAVS